MKHQTYRETVVACHGSIGRAIYYTALTITVGFSILAFSNFIPTIYFGLLTGFAMMVALMSNLTLLAAVAHDRETTGPGVHVALLPSASGLPGYATLARPTVGLIGRVAPIDSPHRPMF